MPGFLSQAGEEIKQRLENIEEQGLFRSRLSLDSAQARQVCIDGREVLNFSSNDYLGLANDPRLISALQEGATAYGVGSGASPLVCGRSQAHSELEQAVAKMTGRDRAIIFSSGYLANLALVNTLARGRKDTIFQDRLNHASIIDGALSSRAKLVRYPHGDLVALKKSLEKSNSKLKLVLTDSVFSMDGDIADLVQLASLCQDQAACLVVDDAHGFGVFGQGGEGVLTQLGLGQVDVPLMMATFGKAIGCAGAFVAGPGDLIELMIQTARPYIYSTALAPALAFAANRSLRMVIEENWRREHLQKLIKRFRLEARQAGLPVLDSSSPIQPLVAGQAQKAVALSDALLRSGVLVTAIRPPTVPANTSRLRITLTAGHTEEDVSVLVNELVRCGAADRTGSLDHG